MGSSSDSVSAAAALASASCSAPTSRAAGGPGGGLVPRAEGEVVRLEEQDAERYNNYVEDEEDYKPEDLSDVKYQNHF